MNLSSCVGCGGLVPEVNGQFEVLDSYYLGEDGPPEESAGDWHTLCLLRSPYGSAWHDARLQNHTMVRGYKLVANVGQWSVIRHPRTGEQLALSQGGELRSLEFSAGLIRRASGGDIYRVEEPEYNLHLENRTFIQTIQNALTAAKTFPVMALFEMLEIADRVYHPEALEGALIHFSRSLARGWSNTCVTARRVYGVFVPAELAPFVSSDKQRSR